MSLIELNRLINDSLLSDLTKQWALRRAPTFKRPSKVTEWTNKFKNINAERAVIKSRRQLQAYQPSYVEATINVYKERNNERRLAKNQHEDGYEPEDSDRLLILPSWFVRGFTPGFLPNASLFIEQAAEVAPETSYDQLATLKNFLASGNIKIKLLSSSALPKQLASRHARSPRERLLRDNDRRLSHPWLKYSASIHSDNFAEMFTNPKYFYEDACIPNAILNTWADKWNSRSKKETTVLGRPRIPDITLQSIHAAVFPDLPFDPKRPMSFVQAKPWFEKYKVKARAYHNNRLIDEFLPASQNKILEKTLVILIKDDHAHHISDPKILESISKRALHVGSMSSKYSLTCGEAPLFSGVVSSLADLFEKAQALTRATNEQLVVRFLWRNEMAPLMNAVEELFNNHRWLVKVQLGSNDQVTSFTLAWNNILVTVVSPDFGQFARVSKTKLYDLSMEQIQETYNLQHELRKCNGSRLLSKYAPGFAETLKAFRAAPPYCKFGDVPNGTYECIDQVKCYTTIVEDTSNFPKFNRFDRFCPYDGHALEPLTLYVVSFRGRRSMAVNCEFPTDRCLKYGKYIVGQPVTIESYCRPSYIVENPYLEQLRIIEKCTLPRDITKMITNANWGCLGKVRNTKKSVELCTTLEEAQSLNSPDEHASGPRGLITKIEGTPFHKFTINNQAELTEGFLPIQQLIYDEARYRLAELVRLVGESNVVGVHTDCVYVKSLPSVVPPRCRFEIKKMDCKRFEVNAVDYAPEYHEIPQPKVFTFEDEYTQGFADHVFQAHRRVFIRGKYPGVGKSELAKRFVDQDCIVACPSNAQAQVHNNGMTLYRLCGRVVDSDMQVRSGETANQVVFEEILMNNSHEFEMIENYLEQHPDIQNVIATGDFKQCEAIEADWNPLRSKEKFYTDLMNSLFPVHIELREIKRQSTPEAKEFIMRMYEDFWVYTLPNSELIERYTKEWEGELPYEATHIAYRNEVVDWVNATIHGNREAYSPGLKLVYFREKAMGKKNPINKNCEVTIESLTDTHVTFVGHDPMPRTVLTSFEYTYAYTAHKIQGRSFDGLTIIYDANFIHVTRNWLWVALTRARDPSQVYRAETPVKSELQRSYIQGKIDTHYHEDVKHGRDAEDYIDVDWVLAQSKLQHHKCYNPLGDCDATMRFRPAKKGRNDNAVLTVDRLDSRFGHTKSNCKLCCWQCNRRKKDSHPIG
jgi:hypothetical protein